MIVEVDGISVANVWAESFKDRNTGEEVEYYRAMLNKVGEPPTQLAVARDDYEEMAQLIGYTGVAVIEIDAQPGRRVRVYLKGVR